MTRLALAAATALATLTLTAPDAIACTARIYTDAAMGETWSSALPEGYRREQAEWRARSEVVLLTQVRSGRLVSNGEIEFTLVPYVSVYGGDMPAQDLLFRWHPGNSCNRFPLMIADILVVYVDPTGAIISAIRPEDLQDRPPEFGRYQREIARGMLLPREAP